MKRIFLVLSIVIILCGTMYSQTRSTSLNVNFSVPEVNSIVINESSLNFNFIYGGPTGMIYAPVALSATYNITSTGTNKRVLASLDSPMPPNMSLLLRADPPTGAISSGDVNLTTAPQVLLQNISNVHQSNLLLRFTMRAELGAPARAGTRTVLLTISD
jgi:hypothetical protein